MSVTDNNKKHMLMCLLHSQVILNLVLYSNNISVPVVPQTVLRLYSPEVWKEALQVVGVAKLVFALISTSYQTAPGSVQLSALLLDVIHCLWMGLDQTLCCLTKRIYLDSGAGKISVRGNSYKKDSKSYFKLHFYMTDLITQSSQVSLKAFMFTLQCLNTGQVMTVVVSVECLVLLLNPLFSFISIPNCTNTVCWECHTRFQTSVWHPCYVVLQRLVRTCGIAAPHGHCPACCSFLQPAAAVIASDYLAPT